MESKLYRPKEDRVIAGVCSGIARYFKIDVIIIRLIFVLLAIYAGSGVLIYLILLIIMPEENGKSYADDVKKNINENKKTEIKNELKNAASEIKKSAAKNSRNTEVFALILIFLGLMFLMQNFLPVIFNFAKLWPLFFVLLGIIILFSGGRKE